jgi:predicted membrane channel-forming protein YqfA (hemolysin III family)
MFVAMGASAVIPVLHGIFLFGFAQLERQMGVSWLVLQGVLYISGAAIYAVSIVSVLCSRTILIRTTDSISRTSEAWLL